MDDGSSRVDGRSHSEKLRIKITLVSDDGRKNQQNWWFNWNDFFSYPTLNERVLLSSLTSKTSGDWFKKKKTK